METSQFKLESGQKSTFKGEGESILKAQV
ncbi:uncharacterized protein G2W53_012906 [Senna tora]|uniref:Uncharacterized protein n=1 Tax=Senna tora TaxID=362788 RepID=A0A834TXU5_9FABA|nr:uncharacterized protein G2W53_012906 [Senna tora]